MAKITVTVDDKAFEKQLQSIKEYVEEGLVKEMVKEYRKQTPIDGGNARRKTIRKGSSVIGDYPYAGVLDQGLYPNPPKATLPIIEYPQPFQKPLLTLKA